MTGRDSRTRSRGGADDGATGSALPDVGVDVATSIVEETLHGSAAVIAGDVGVQVLPDTLDAVGVGAVRGQEVQDDASGESGERLARAHGLVDAVVVEDQMHPASMSIAAGQQPEQLTEECRV